MSTIINPEKNKKALLKTASDADIQLMKVRRTLRFKRFLKYDQDKRKLEKIRNQIGEAIEELNSLIHILSHDEYWDKTRSRR